MTEMDWATGAYGDAGVTEMGCAMGSIYSGDPGVDRSHLIYIILSYNELYTPSFASFDLTRSARHFVDPPGWVVS